MTKEEIAANLEAARIADARTASGNHGPNVARDRFLAECRAEVRRDYAPTFALLDDLEREELARVDCAVAAVDDTTAAPATGETAQEWNPTPEVVAAERFALYNFLDWLRASGYHIGEYAKQDDGSRPACEVYNASGVVETYLAR